MIIEQNVSLIVSTCRLQESGRAKCNQFWPNQDKPSKFNITQDENSREDVLVQLVDQSQQGFFGTRDMVAQLSNGE